GAVRPLPRLRAWTVRPSRVLAIGRAAAPRADRRHYHVRSSHCSLSRVPPTIDSRVSGVLSSTHVLVNAPVQRGAWNVLDGHVWQASAVRPGLGWTTARLYGSQVMLVDVTVQGVCAVHSVVVVVPA